MEGGVEERRREVEKKRTLTNRDSLFAFILGSHGHRKEHCRPLWGGLEVGKLPSVSKHVRDVASSRGTDWYPALEEAAFLTRGDRKKQKALKCS